MANNPVVNTLTFTGNVAEQATIQAQGIAGGLTFLLPNTVPIQGQLLEALSINGNNVFLGWVSPQSSSITLSQILQSGATSGQVIEWNGTAWAPSSTVPGSGTVTSVALTAPAEFSVAGSPITGAGTLAISKANQSANTVWAGPTTGAAAPPAFRALVAADLGAGIVSLAAINSKQGSTGNAVQLTLSGATVAGDVVTYDANSNVVDSGTLLSSLASNASVALKANSASPTFTGIVTAAHIQAAAGGLLVDATGTDGVRIADNGNVRGILVGGTTAGAGHIWLWSPGGTSLVDVSDTGTAITGASSFTSANPTFFSAQGNGSKVQLSTGTTTSGNIVSYDSNGNTADSGVSVANVPLKAVTVLSSAQLLALGTTPVQVVPAPGIGKYANVLYGVASYHFGTTPYTGAGTGAHFFVINPATQPNVTTAFGLESGFIDSLGTSTNSVIQMGENFGFSATAANLDNAAFTISFDTASNILTLGDGTVTVTIYYTIESSAA